MSRRYDSRTTIFSPEGRLYQVEYAMQAIDQAGAAIGILGTNGVVLAAEKKTTSKLLESEKTDKMYQLDEHIVCAVAGIRADANILINNARVTTQRHMFKYDEPMPVEQLIQQICDLKQGYTQFGGQRTPSCTNFARGCLFFTDTALLCQQVSVRSVSRSCLLATTNISDISCTRATHRAIMEDGRPPLWDQTIPRLNPS
jgi:hypothetical protein